MNTTAIDAAIADYSEAKEKLKDLTPELASRFPNVEGMAKREQSPKRVESPNGADKQTEDSLPQKPRLRGFGYLYKRGSLWWIRYSVRGKDLRESSGSEREADAMRLLKRRWKEVGKGRFIGPSEERVLMDSLFDALLVDYQNNQRRSTSTLVGRLRHLRVAFGNLRAG